MEGTASTTGKEFFSSLAVHIARALKVGSVRIATCSDPDCAEVQMLAVFEKGKLLYIRTDKINNTPEKDLILGKEKYIPAGLDLEFPEEKKWKSFFGVPMSNSEGTISGYISVRHGDSMQCTPQDLDILKIFAARAVHSISKRKSRPVDITKQGSISSGFGGTRVPDHDIKQAKFIGLCLMSFSPDKGPGCCP